MKTGEKLDTTVYNYDRLGDLLFIFQKNHKTYLNNLLCDYDLNLIQVLCILKIDSEENLNQKDLSDSLYLTKGAITKAIKKLESNGIVIRKKSSIDKRYNELMLSDKGKKLIPIINDINQDWEKKMGFDELSPEFLETFKELTFKSADLNDKKLI